MRRLRDVETGGRLDRVKVLAAQREIELPWASRDTLLNRIRPLESEAAAGIVEAFEKNGASRSVELTRSDQELLFELLEMWVRDVDRGDLPEGVWDLRCALIDDLHDLTQRE
jgi:hypothetical protein